MSIKNMGGPPKRTNRGRKFPGQRRLTKFRPQPHAFRGFRLTGRDLDIVRVVERYRFLAADHIRALVAGSRQQVTRRLQALFHTKHLARMIPLMRARLLKGEELRPRLVYALATKGKEALLSSGMPAEEISWTPDYNLRKEGHLEHELMISNFRVTLALALADHGGAELTGWLDDADIRDSVTVEWVKHHKGKPVVYRVNPDGYAATAVRGEHNNWFLETDNNTEELGRIAYKYRGYWHYFTPASPYWSRYEAPERRLALWVTTSERRMENMIQTLTSIEEFGGKGLRQFRFTTEDEFSVSDPPSILAPIWRVVGDVRLDDTGRVRQYQIERKGLLE